MLTQNQIANRRLGFFVRINATNKKKATHKIKTTHNRTMIHNREGSVNRYEKVSMQEAENNNEAIKSVGPTDLLNVEKFKLLQKVKDGLLTFFHGSTIHGVVFLTKKGLHFFER